MSPDPSTTALQTIAAALQYATSRLCAVSSTARLDAEVLLAAVLQQPRSHLLAHAEIALPKPAQAQFLQLLERRASGVPVAHLTGHKEFWSLDLEVSGDVLVPRPETELLVELALELLSVDAPAKVLDLGTGSGAIALAIAHERPRARIVATDSSATALIVACRNAERLRLGNITFFAGDWYEPVGAMHFDLIVSNPPYIAADDPALKTPELLAEPSGALCPGPTGLEAIQRIALRACEHLKKGGWAAIEHGASQAKPVAALFSQCGLSNIRALKDLAGRDRVTCGQYN